ncbi:MAG TPA: hypothetical protein VGR55_07540 [Candidatus Acidoferrum sp.]|nr:hypothetical protein [Candidatus Acidoferrum sp.]
MSAKKLGALVFLTCVLIFALATQRHARAQSSKTLYPKMAPVEQYLMDRDAEIALARTAAPESISRDATVLVLGRRGHETAVEGTNGFVCVVDRGWSAPIGSPEFWNPKNRSPICFNPQAVSSVLPAIIKRAELALAGKSREQIQELTKAAYANKELPTTLEPGAMSFMMSKDAYLTDDGGHNLAHLMFYTPLIDGGNWGADLPKSPVMLIQKGPPEPFNIFIVPVGKWSDGTPAPLPR